MVQMSSGLRVKPKESLMGRIYSSSYFPQYLTQAMLGDDLYLVLKFNYSFIPHTLIILSPTNLNLTCFRGPKNLYFFHHYKVSLVLSFYFSVGFEFEGPSRENILV